MICTSQTICNKPESPFKKNKATYVVCWLDLLTPVSDFSTQRKLDSVASALPLSLATRLVASCNSSMRCTIRSNNF